MIVCLPETSLDEPHWVTEAGGKGKEQEKLEGTEAFFGEIYRWLRRGGGGEEGEPEETGTGEGEAAPNGASISLT